MAADIGYPKTCVIFYAVDEDVSPDEVNAYFAGLAKGSTHPVGVYGSLRVCEGMRSEGHVTYLWQTEAWSGTDVSKHAHIYQRVKATKNIPDGCDEDVLLKPLPLWAPHSHEPVSPTPDPAAVGTATGLGPMPRIAARVVLKALKGRKKRRRQARPVTARRPRHRGQRRAQDRSVGRPRGRVHDGPLTSRK
jgi:hypothetical protein